MSKLAAFDPNSVDVSLTTDFYGTAKILPKLRNSKYINLNKAILDDMQNYSIFAASRMSSEENSKRKIIPSLRMKTQEHFRKVLKPYQVSKCNSLEKKGSIKAKKDNKNISLHNKIRNSSS